MEDKTPLIKQDVIPNYIVVYLMVEYLYITTNDSMWELDRNIPPPAFQTRSTKKQKIQ